ncbi:hypothetical protein GN956_G18617 [Arapaima gigas]
MTSRVPNTPKPGGATPDLGAASPHLEAPPEGLGDKGDRSLSVDLGRRPASRTKWADPVPHPGSLPITEF